jgi:Domain of unknown function (DUF4430)
VVTRDFGRSLLGEARAAPGQSALNALRRSARVGTAYGGRFVTSINGLEGSRSSAHDWLYFVNGFDPGVGAADTTLHQGDVEWWDYRYWRDFIGVPAVIGSWPEPFVHGLGGQRPTVAVQGPSCAGSVRGALLQRGARLGGDGAYAVTVETFAAGASTLADWRSWSFTVRVVGGTVGVYRGGKGWQTLPGAAAVIVARVPGGVPGRSFQLIVAGRDTAAACAAAHTLATNPAEIDRAYAVALDAHGTVIAQGGRS